MSSEFTKLATDPTAVLDPLEELKARLATCLDQIRFVQAENMVLHHDNERVFRNYVELRGAYFFLMKDNITLAAKLEEKEEGLRHSDVA